MKRIICLLALFGFAFASADDKTADAYRKIADGLRLQAQGYDALAESVEDGSPPTKPPIDPPPIDPPPIEPPSTSRGVVGMNLDGIIDFDTGRHLVDELHHTIMLNKPNWQGRGDWLGRWQQGMYGNCYVRRGTYFLKVKDAEIEIGGQTYKSDHTLSFDVDTTTVRLTQFDEDSRVQLLRKDTPTAYWNPDYLDLCKHFKILRDLNFSQVNNSPRVTHLHMPRQYDQQCSPTYGANLSLFLDLCHLTHNAPWICIPHQADDSYLELMGEYLGQFKTKTEAEGLDLTPYVEYSNEMWNDQFAQAALNKRMAQEWFGSSGWSQRARAQGRLSADVFKRLDEHFSDYHKVLAWSQRSRRGEHDSAINEFTDQYGSKPDVWSAAAYIHVMPHDCGSNETPESLMAKLRTALPRTCDEIDEHSATAERHGITFSAYEGGPHIVPGASNSNQTKQASLDCNRLPEMKDLLHDLQNHWNATSNGTLVHLVLVQAPRIKNDGSVRDGNDWHHLRDMTDIDAPKWQFVLETSSPERKP